MKVLLQSIGTRGDIEPFLAQAEILATKGWQVACQFPEQFREIVEELGYDFYPIDRRFLEMLESQTGLAVTGGSGNYWKRVHNFIKLARTGLRLQHILLKEQQQAVLNYQPHKILYHPKCVYPLLWELAYKGSTTMICPIPFIVHEVKELSAMTFSGNGNYGHFINKLSYRLINGIRGLVFNRSLKKYRKGLPISRINSKIISRCLLKETQAVYTLSPSLFTRPAYWPSHIQVAGYYERSPQLDWQPDPGLYSFLQKHTKFLFISFGSMRNTHPRAKTKAFVEVLSKFQIPAIINTSWGGLEQPEYFPDHLYFVKNIPYSWILAKTFGVVHHGGAGTTHAAVKNGCASLIIPHIVDQFYWNRKIWELQLGPLGVPVKKLTAARLEPLIKDLWNNKNYRRKAAFFKEQMKLEADADKLMAMLRLPIP